MDDTKSTFSNNPSQNLNGMLKGKKGQQNQEAEVSSADQQSLSDDAEKQIKDLTEQLQKLQEQITVEKDQRLRVLADFENHRRRVDKERVEMANFGKEKMINEILPVLDALELTLTHAPQNSEKDPIIEGVTLVVRQFCQALEKAGCVTITGENAPFDPHKQEAIGSQPTNEVTEGHVLLVHRKGFMLGDRLIRPALVTVAAKADKNPFSEDEQTVH